jgi:UDP-N-acetylmuramyl pentapeptide phosphotransferase/UDP-N-acetylglucosamine-1-phosphate transferase
MAEAYLPRLDVWGLDSLLKLAPFAIVVTSFCVAGVANSINIIDGFHGIAGSTTVIILAAMAYLCWESGDLFVMKLALVGIGATLGFLWVNYPTGRLFLGDGGAYFIGFWIAEVAVLTVARNPEINAWRVLAICAYPVIEVLYSVYRRTVLRKRSAGAPDRLHLHTLIYRRIICQIMPRDSNPWIRNAAVACIVAAWIATMSLLAVWIGKAIPAAVALVSIQVFLYMVVYTRLVRGHWCLNPTLYMGIRPVARSKSA